MFRSVLIAAAVALLAGCVAPNSQAVPPRSRYHGAPVETFFAQWGAPIASRAFGQGWTMYLWYSGRSSAYVPGHTDNELIGNTAWWQGYRLPDFDPRLECGVRIVAYPDGTIADVLVHEDIIGWWLVPRCRSVFGPPLRD